MAVSVKATKNGIAIIDAARKQKKWTKTALAWLDAAKDLGVPIGQSALRKFWRRMPIDTDHFEVICRAVGVVNWQELVDNSPDNSSNVSETDRWLIEVKAVIQEGEEDLMEQFFQTINQLSGNVLVKKQKIEPGFDQYWQPVELVLAPSRVRSRGKDEPAPEGQVERAKEINFGSGRMVVLTIGLTPESDYVVGAVVEVYPAGDAIHLPPGLQGSILDESGEIVPDLQARTGNATDSLKWEFALEPEEIFGVRLELGNVSITESF